MQCACAVLSTVTCRALQYFSTLCYKRHDFRKALLNVKCVFWLSLQGLSETVPILRRIKRVCSEMYIGLHVQYPLFLSDFYWNLNFLDSFSKNTHIPNFTKIRPVGAELLYAERRRVMIKLTVACSNCANTVPVILVRFLMRLESSGQFFEKYSYT
jgi:hypothetical protein